MRVRMKGWRTVAFNVVAAVVAIAIELAPIVAQVVALPEVVGILPQHWHAWYFLIVAVVNLALRAATDTPIGKDRP